VTTSKHDYSRNAYSFYNNKKEIPTSLIAISMAETCAVQETKSQTSDVKNERQTSDLNEHLQFTHL